jgi:hypothetical protein
VKVSCTPGLFWSIVRNRQVLPCISIPTRTDFENGSKKKTATLTVITRLRRFISQPHLPAILFAAGCALTLALALVGTTTLLLAYIAVVVLGLLAATVALWLRMALINVPWDSACLAWRVNSAGSDSPRMPSPTSGPSGQTFVSLSRIGSASRANSSTARRLELTMGPSFKTSRWGREKAFVQPAVGVRSPFSGHVACTRTSAAVLMIPRI